MSENNCTCCCTNNYIIDDRESLLKSYEIASKVAMDRLNTNNCCDILPDANVGNTTNENSGRDPMCWGKPHIDNYTPAVCSCYDTWNKKNSSGSITTTPSLESLSKQMNTINFIQYTKENAKLLFKTFTSNLIGMGTVCGTLYLLQDEKIYELNIGDYLILKKVDNKYRFYICKDESQLGCFLHLDKLL